MESLSQKLKFLPDQPGVYVMLDKNGQIIYVGKAKILKNRVKQYFTNGDKTEKVRAMVNSIADFYYILTPSEIDALSLENNLIKKHKPRYNILLKDDKTYPYVKVDLKQDFPKFSIVRKVKKDGAKYFGPFMAGVSANQVLEIINGEFKLRTCDKKLSVTNCNQKPCLNFQLKKCSGACAGEISKLEYKKRVNSAIEFLNGEVKDIKGILNEKMLSYAKTEDFELALKYKNLLESLDKIWLKRLTALPKSIDADVIAESDNEIYRAVSILFVRNGKMLGGKNFSFESGAISSGEALRQFILSYYKEGVQLPKEIITSKTVEDDISVQEYLSTSYNKQVKLVVAKKGAKKELCDMAEKNAQNHLNTSIAKIKHKNDMTILACKALKEKLNLKNFPKRMECYDISNISGVDKVGSMTVFINGEADRSSYRRFKIKSFEGADDYRSHQEMMTRRLERMNTSPDKFPKPDLMVIDGGKGQLSAVLEVFKQFGVQDVDVIALAEKNEEIYLPFNSSPVILSKNDYSLKMLQRIRDEAHRFAITYHRNLRDKRAIASVLDGIKGLGKVKKKALIEKFKDLFGVINASKEELSVVDGIGENIAQNIIDKLTKEGLK